MQGLQIPEESRLAGRLGGALYLTAAITGCLLLVMPGVDAQQEGLVVGLAAISLVWGVLSLVVIPWERVHVIVTHLSLLAGLALTATVTAQTGGATSPARFYLLFVVFFTCWFYPGRVAILYIALCSAVHALPLLYDSGVVDEGFLAELLVILPAYATLGFLISSSKALLTRMREESDRLSGTDPLTGLANRRAFAELIETSVDGRRASDVTGLLLVDLDDLKAANTALGHTGGDRVLCAAADALRQVARADDLVARLGGDEFAIVVKGVTPEVMERLADRVIERIQRADVALGLAGFSLRASVGWAMYPQHAARPADLFEQADFALRRAKTGGKGQVEAAFDTPQPAVAHAR